MALVRATLLLLNSIGIWGNTHTHKIIDRAVFLGNRNIPSWTIVLISLSFVYLRFLLEVSFCFLEILQWLVKDLLAYRKETFPGGNSRGQCFITHVHRRVAERWRLKTFDSCMRNEKTFSSLVKKLAAADWIIQKTSSGAKCLWALLTGWEGHK